jgi:hypothetical protein
MHLLVVFEAFLLIHGIASSFKQEDRALSLSGHETVGLDGIVNRSSFSSP